MIHHPFPILHGEIWLGQQVLCDIAGFFFYPRPSSIKQKKSFEYFGLKKSFHTHIPCLVSCFVRHSLILVQWHNKCDWRGKWTKNPRGITCLMLLVSSDFARMHQKKDLHEVFIHYWSNNSVSHIFSDCLCVRYQMIYHLHSIE